MVRLVLAAAAAGGASPRRLAAAARVPMGALAQEEAMVPARGALRLWELAEQALDDPRVALGAAARCRLGDLGLFDYLFGTAATLRAGLAASSRYLPLVTTSGRLRAQVHSGQTVYSYSCPEAGGRGRELAAQFWIALFCARARAATGRAVIPARVTFTQPAPRCHRAFTEIFGAGRIDFAAPATTVTLAASDLDLPLRGADPALAAILRRCAVTLPPPAVTTWHEHFRQQLSEAIDSGTPCLRALASRMSLSPRTLQRRLAEHDTTWRAELDTARRHRAQRVITTRSPSMTYLARHLGYTDPRSARRALHRWNGPREPEPSET